MDNKLEFIETILPGLDWQEDGDKLVFETNDGNSFSGICSKLDSSSNIENMDEEDEINLMGVDFKFKGYDDNDNVYNISAVGDFTEDKYRVSVW